MLLFGFPSLCFGEIRFSQFSIPLRLTVVDICLHISQSSPKNRKQITDSGTCQKSFHMALTTRCLGIIMFESHVMQMFGLKINRKGENLVLQSACMLCIRPGCTSPSRRTSMYMKVAVPKGRVMEGSNTSTYRLLDMQTILCLRKL